MKLIEIVFETIIDASDKFKKRKNDAFAKKLAGLAADLPNAFANQTELENEVKDRIKKILDDANKKFSKYRLMLAKLTKHYQDDTNIIDILIWTYLQIDRTDVEQKKIAVNFFNDHLNETLTIAREIKTSLEDLKIEMNKRDWPTKSNWERYTKIVEEIYAANNRIQDLRKIQRLIDNDDF